MLKNLSILFLLPLLLLAKSQPHSWPESPADTGPKPTMTFHFVFEGEPVAILGGQLLQCDTADCANGRPLTEGGPQRFECPSAEPDECFALAYGFADYQQLVVEFSDRTRTSQVFRPPNFEADLTVQVTADALLVEPMAPSLARLAIALLVTLLVEMLVAALFLMLFRDGWPMLPWALLASVITLPLLWLGLGRLGGVPLAALCGGELLVVAVEALILRLAGRRRDFGWGRALLLSLLMNGASFVVGQAL
jgi:hypothetical protein